MRSLLVVSLVACTGGGGGSAPAPQTFTFGPYHLTPAQEITDQCVSVTLNNDTELAINSVELTTATGFHHSNWFFVPESYYGADGTWPCSDRQFDQANAATAGGVLFAQSTQSPHEVQSFPPGVAVIIPAHSKIVATTHLLDAGDAPLDVPLSLTITPIANVTTKLAAMSFENESIQIPPHAVSKFTVECDIGAHNRDIVGTPPDFNIYYALAHYHTLGTEMSLEAVRADGTATTVYDTMHRIGDTLGGGISPAFSMAGYEQLRFSCVYDNPRDATVGWGVGDQEMCVLLAFTDSAFVWAGGAIARDGAGTPTDTGTELDFTHPCSLITAAVND